MAGVSPTAAYRHFADKDALLAALAVRGFREFGQALGEAAARDPQHEVSARGRAYIRFALARPGRFRLMFGPLLARVAPQNPELREASERTFAAIERAVGDKDEAMRRWGLVHGLAHLLLDGAMKADDIEELIERLIP